MNVATSINKEVLGQIAAESIANIKPTAPNAQRWIRAIARAVAEVETNPFLTYNHDSHSLLIMSQNNGNTYTANGSCQCRAFELGQPCKHRALNRLIAIYIERNQAVTKTAICDCCGVTETGTGLKAAGWFLGNREQFCPNCND